MRRKNIMVVDDDEQILMLLKHLLETNSYDCTLAINAKEARNAMKDQKTV